MNEILKNEKLILKIYDNKLDELYEKNSNKGYKIWQKALSIIPDGNMLLSKRPDNFLPFGWPTYYKNAKGYKITDLQGNSLSDFSYMGVGTNILGYSNSKIDNYVIRKIKSSISTTLNSKEDFILAEKLIEINSDWAEMVKLTRTGAEASSVAIRISRAATGKSKVIICGYHGWQDWYLSTNLKDNSNLDNHLIKNLNINGVPKELERTTYQFQYNDINSLKKILDSDKDIGTLIMEVKRNINPTKGFLHKVRSLCNKYGVVLIFDECTSGFRENYGGLHKFFKVNPDICIYGKALGNGYPINAVIGKRHIMEQGKKSFISSTFWTEGMGPAAAIRTLEIFKKEQSWKYLIDYGKKIKKLWSQLSNTYNLKLEISGLNAIPIFNFNSSYHPKYKTFLTQEMLKKNILATNAVYISTKHDKSIFDKYAINLDKIFLKFQNVLMKEKILIIYWNILQV